MASKMYQSQSVAFEHAASYLGHTTNSTHDSPPSISMPDWNVAALAKQKVIDSIASAPSCPHCKITVNRGCFQEVDGGSIMFYCRIAGGCSRSHVMFVAPEMKIPVYRQVCIFQASLTETPHSDVANIATAHGIAAELHVPVTAFAPLQLQEGQPMDMSMRMQGQSIQDFRNHYPVRALPASELEPPLQQFMQNLVLQPHRQMLAMQPVDNASCNRCNESYNKHEHSRYDQNGWVIDHYDTATLPFNYPRL